MKMYTVKSKDVMFLVAANSASSAKVAIRLHWHIGKNLKSLGALKAEVVPDVTCKHRTPTILLSHEIA